MDILTSSGKDPFFRETYRDINPEFCYGIIPKQYLSARQVKNLRCEESKKDCFESTLYWTELPKFIPDPDADPTPENITDTKQVIGEREAQYTYSIRESVEDMKRRKAEHIVRKWGDAYYFPPTPTENKR